MTQSAEDVRVHSDQPFSLLHVAEVILRRRYLVMGTVAISLLAFIVLTVFGTTTWTTGTSFFPQQAANNASQLSSLAGQFGVTVPTNEGTLTPEFYSRLIQSRTVLDEVASAPYPVGSDVVGLVDVLELGGHAPEVAKFEVIRWLETQALRVTTDIQTGVVSVTVTTPSPQLSYGIATKILDGITSFNLRHRRSQATAEREFVEERLEVASENLRNAEDLLGAFLRNNRQFQNSPELIFQHDRLQRAVVMRQRLYTSLLESYENARIEEVRNIPVISILEPPQVPAIPDARNLATKFAVAVLFGWISGTFLALGIEYVSRERQRHSLRAPDMPV